MSVGLKVPESDLPMTKLKLTIDYICKWTSLFPGLSLGLMVEQDEYIGPMTHIAGAIVAVHRHDIHPFPEDDGIYLQPGRLTSIGVEMVHGFAIIRKSIHCLY